ncbi:DNA repair protein RecN [Paucilactobacillus oligofermentans DSM 15707 = LMG 22743]|uniref:DNA repair protein RecN n=1 Tax=Paucilactobacillus oligofermentans DSM 15707 = LMG 22743 TaxID=1423778 RepID=A0A0R1REZ6_9LACO|nr:DNA repair protein RecN [Paucilactobacillus oligofermentans]KRL54921.1 DNA repair protein RecN [Paucilactobacillus oligofermentans DSM 15707 = LMG 22743]CUS26164.1 DNA repair protein RecN [Paucilactobacillus oligofermentans DSM 15707 = LMG 22743]
MLQELTIENLAIIDHLSLNFSDQMTVLTGETGAGKSIIIDAVGLLVGGRGSQELIRKGEGSLKVQGQFEISDQVVIEDVLNELGVEITDGTLVIQREINRNGRNIIRVNGTLMNTSSLKKIGSRLVDIEGQNDHQLLMQPEQHLGLLDEFTNQDDDLLAKYETIYEQYTDTIHKIKQKQATEQQSAQRIDMLEFQVNEINNANLIEDEDVELTNEQAQLNHFQQINTALQTVQGVLAGDDNGSSLDAIASAKESLEEISDFNDDYTQLNDRVSEAYFTLQDVANEVGRQLDNLSFDEGRLNEIEQRLNLINDLERKYGDSVTEILVYCTKISAELESMQENNVTSDELEERLVTLKSQLQTLGNNLSQNRKQAAKQIEKDIKQQLNDLYMEKAVFEIKFMDKKDDMFYSNGIDQVEFYIQTNPGEEMGPLAKIASGGELSRVMLALKTIFARSQGVTSIIFDEVDTGVSGRVAQAIAEKIKVIANQSQVLCITHLPQVAAMAQHHLLISKAVQDDRTITSVDGLDEESRIDELARMLAGAEVTPLTVEHAKELLKMAK